MEYAIETRNNVLKTLFETIMPSIVDQLKLTNSKKAVLIKTVGELPDKHDGVTYNIKFLDTMLVLIKSPKNNTEKELIAACTTLAHEMVHVQQLAKGIMQFLPKESKLWRGKKYTKKTPYLDQPWEIAALAKQEIILRRALES